MFSDHKVVGAGLAAFDSLVLVVNAAAVLATVHSFSSIGKAGNFLTF